jgi:8-oxo-dGTP diphosphatase
MTKLSKEFKKGFLKEARGRTEVGVVAVICDGKILMGKRRDNGKWTNPGGHLDAGEDPEAGARRELMEEAGIEAKKLRHLRCKKVTAPDGKKLIIHAYAYDCKEKPSSTMKKDPDNEVYRWQWFDLANMPEEVLNNLHSPKNVLLEELGVLPMTKEASLKSQKALSSPLRYFHLLPANSLEDRLL